MKREKGILDGFSACERLAILTKTNGNPTAETIKAITEHEWRCMRAIGDRFVAKLVSKGWLGEPINRTRYALTSYADRKERAKERRVERLSFLIDRAQQKIKLWQDKIQDINQKGKQ